MIRADRRQFARRDTGLAIQVLIVPRYPNNSENNDDSFSAKMVNQSEKGFCFETDRVLQPGTNITVKMNGTKTVSSSKDAYYTLDGKIIWCHKVAGLPQKFGIGVKILRKAVQADILTSRFGPSTAESP
jgi:hypothetical protein